jgi:hypothetical protein
MSQKPASDRAIGRTVRRLVVALVVVLALAVPAASANGVARVWIANDQPLVVRGTGFHAASQISVSVSKLKRTYRSKVMSGSAGGFAAHFKVNLPTRCGTTVVTATDAAGRRMMSRIVANDCNRGGGKI